MLNCYQQVLGRLCIAWGFLFKCFKAYMMKNTVTKTESLGILHHMLLLCHRKLQGFRVGNWEMMTSCL